MGSVVVVVVVEVSEAVPVLTFSSDAVSPKSALSVWEDSEKIHYLITSLWDFPIIQFAALQAERSFWQNC